MLSAVYAQIAVYSAWEVRGAGRSDPGNGITFATLAIAVVEIDQYPSRVSWHAVVYRSFGCSSNKPRPNLVYIHERPVRPEESAGYVCDRHFCIFAHCKALYILKQSMDTDGKFNSIWLNVENIDN
jgi:hypothetical protein